MDNPAVSQTDNRSKNIEQLLDSANSASETVAALHVAFLAFVAHLGCGFTINRILQFCSLDASAIAFQSPYAIGITLLQTVESGSRPF